MKTVYLKYFLISIFLLSIVAFFYSKHFIEAGIMLSGLSIVLLAEKNEKAKEILNKIF